MMVRKVWRTVFIVLTALSWGIPALGQGILIDHTCTDISRIPDAWLTQVKSQVNFHYAHTSHGSQIMTGLDRLALGNAKYAYYPDNCTMPVTTSHLSLMDGQYQTGGCETYVTPDLYWQGTTALNITRNVLNTFGTVNVSGWSWCTQLDYYSQTDAQAYLNAMAQLESEYPGVTFVYMTGNAQDSSSNRYQRNNQIRTYCRNNNKVLFDFADLDCWYNGDQNVVGGIPMEHPHYNGDEAGHTTFESCENKARAFWWMVARLAGWGGVVRCDFNKDSRRDVVYRHPTEGKIGVWYMNGLSETSWQLVQNSSGGPANHGSAWDIKGIGDFNGDGTEDMLYRHTGGNVGIWLMNGLSETTWHYVNNHGTWDIRGVADFNLDGHDDVLYRHPGGNIGVWLMNGTTESTWTLIQNSSGQPANHGVDWDIKGEGDFNGDGRTDVLYRHSGNGNIGVWLMNGTSETTWRYVGNHGTSWDIKGVGDFNQDGWTDVLYRHSGNGNIGVWLMNGTTEDTWQYINNHGNWDIR